MPDQPPVHTGTEYESPSYEEDGLDYEPHRPRTYKEHIETPQGPVILNVHDFKADMKLEVGAIGVEELLKLYDGSILKIKLFGEFTTMMHALTSVGHSVERRVFECADFGVPQKRKRLFVKGSW